MGCHLDLQQKMELKIYSIGITTVTCYVILLLDEVNEIV